MANGMGDGRGEAKRKESNGLRRTETTEEAEEQFLILESCRGSANDGELAGHRRPRAGEASFGSSWGG